MFHIFQHQPIRLYEKPVSTRYETVRVLITVKTRPEPSAKYGETVCVAGFRLDETGNRYGKDIRWIRLYPVPFRYLDEYLQFKKHTIIEVPVIPRRQDPRAESYTPDRSQLKIVSTKPLTWQQRLEYVDPMISELSMCEILKIARTGKGQKPYPSLAVIRPYGHVKLDLEKYKGWTEKQYQSVHGTHHQGTLFETLEVEPQQLQEPRYQAYVIYHCSAACSGHRQMLLDWELERLSLRHQNDSDAQAQEAIYKKYENILAPEKKPVLYVGNQQKYRLTYSVLGIQRTA